MIDAVSYGPDSVRRFGDDVAAARSAPGTTWVRVDGPLTEAGQRVADAFGIHALSLEDVAGDVRPKTEAFDDHAFVLAKTATSLGTADLRDGLKTDAVGLFVGRDWLVTIAPEELPAAEAAWAALETDSRLRRAGPDFAAYRVVDRIVDDYYGLLDEIETDIEAVEEAVLEGPDDSLLATMNAVRVDLLSLRKLLWPTREAVGALARGDPDTVRATTEKYYRDVYDHLVQLVDLTETYRDLVAGSRDVYLNALSQSTNEVMKTLTVVATVVLPLTFVVGVFGMNFGGGAWNMPELGWPYAYPAVMLGMAATAAILVAHFRRSGWLSGAG